MLSFPGTIVTNYSLGTVMLCHMVLEKHEEVWLEAVNHHVVLKARKELIVLL
jgi:hypothetical protein